MAIGTTPLPDRGMDIFLPILILFFLVAGIADFRPAPGDQVLVFRCVGVVAFHAIPCPDRGMDERLVEPFLKIGMTRNAEVEPFRLETRGRMAGAAITLDERRMLHFMKQPPSGGEVDFVTTEAAALSYGDAAMGLHEPRIGEVMTVGAQGRNLLADKCGVG